MNSSVQNDMLQNDAMVKASFEAAAPTVEREYSITGDWLKSRFMLMSRPSTTGSLTFKDAVTRASFTIDVDAGTVRPSRADLVARIGEGDEMWRHTV